MALLSLVVFEFQHLHLNSFLRLFNIQAFEEAKGLFVVIAVLFCFSCLHSALKYFTSPFYAADAG